MTQKIHRIYRIAARLNLCVSLYEVDMGEIASGLSEIKRIILEISDEIPEKADSNI